MIPDGVTWKCLYSKYLDLKHNFERLRGDYSRLQSDMPRWMPPLTGCKEKTER